MMSQSLLQNLIYISQFSLFIGIASFIFAWVEKKIWLEKAGHLILIVLGVIAVWVILSGQIVVPKTVNGIVPREARLMLYMSGLIVSAILAGLAFLMRIFNYRFAKWLNILIVIGSMMLFFMAYELQRA